MKIQIQLDSQCEEPEILIRTAAVTAEIRELVEKLSEKRSDSVVGYDADSAVLLENPRAIPHKVKTVKIPHKNASCTQPCRRRFLVSFYFENRPSSSLILLHIYRSIQPSKSVIFMAEPAIIREFSPPGKPPGGKPLDSPSPP